MQNTNPGPVTQFILLAQKLEKGIGIDYKVPLRQWVLSVPFQLRFLFASYPELMGKALGLVRRTIATWLIHQAGFTHRTARAGAVTFIQHFGSALNLNVH